MEDGSKLVVAAVLFSLLLGFAVYGLVGGVIEKHLPRKIQTREMYSDPVGPIRKFPYRLNSHLLNGTN